LGIGTESDLPVPAALFLQQSVETSGQDVAMPGMSRPVDVVLTGRRVIKGLILHDKLV